MLPAQVTPSMSQKIPYRFRQSSDLRYLTAFPEDGALLLVTRKSDGDVHSTLLVQVGRFRSRHFNWLTVLSSLTIREKNCGTARESVQRTLGRYLGSRWEFTLSSFF
jgi:hypothetical protein